MIPKRTRVGATADIPCTEFDSVEVSHIILLRHAFHAVKKTQERTTGGSPYRVPTPISR